jgi:outer membrane protein assembly factor BamB
VRSFDALSGELIWKLDINPKKTPRLERNHFLAAPVLHDNRIYIAGGDTLEMGDRPGRLFCIDPTRTGDLSLEIERDGLILTNSNSGVIWSYPDLGSCRSLVAIHDGLLIALGFDGIVHCLNPKTGERYWQHDTRAQLLGSPLIVDQKVYVTTADGDLFIFALAKEKRPLARYNYGQYIFSSPVFANGVLYVTGGEHLYAIHSGSAPRSSAPWPQWRGPDRDNISSETGLLQSWPENGPPRLWTVTGLGQGIHSVSMADGRLYTVGTTNETETALALDAESGEKIWAQSLGKVIRENPLMRWLTQRSPTVDGDRVYNLTAAGELFCLRATDGSVLWQRSYSAEFNAPRHPFGLGDAPLIDGNHLICAPFGSNTFIVALDKYTGNVRWQTPFHPAPRLGHAATVISEAGGVRQYIVFHGKGLSSFAAADGKHLWTHDRTKISIASSLTPLLLDRLIVSPNGYGGGLSLIELTRADNEWHVSERYHRAGSFDAFQDDALLVGYHIYLSAKMGIPACFELSSGQKIWESKPSRGEGRLAATYADGHLYIRHANGIMTLLEASPVAYREKGTFAIPDNERALGVTHPVIAHRRLYIRDNDRLHCYDISTEAFDRPPFTPRQIDIASATASETSPPRSGVDRAPDAVFVATPRDVVSTMLEAAALQKGELLIDLGSGDGRILAAAARQHAARAIGYEIDPRLVELSREAIQTADLQDLVRVEHADIFEADFTSANVVTTFLYPHLMTRLIPQFNKLKAGSRIISHQFEIPGIKPDQMIEVRSAETGETHRIFLWKTPLSKVTNVEK